MATVSMRSPAGTNREGVGGGGREGGEEAGKRQCMPRDSHLQSTQPVTGPFGQFGALHTPLKRWVFWPLLLNHILGRSRVATVTVSPVVSSTCVPYGESGLMCHSKPFSLNACAETVELTHSCPCGGFSWVLYCNHNTHACRRRHVSRGVSLSATRSVKPN